jgi:hypothetical protein
VINSTPNGLHHIYERNWTEIVRLSEGDRERAISLLRWTTFALRPLTISEMTEALLISQNCDKFRVDELPDAIDLDYIETEICYYSGSLVEVRSPHAESLPGMRTVDLAHFSVKEFLRHKLAQTEMAMELTGARGSFTEDVQNTLLAKMCLRYVSCPAVWLENSFGEHNQVLGSFRHFAAGSWQQHDSVSGVRDSEVVELLNNLFDVRTAHWLGWRNWFDANDKEGGEEKSKNEDAAVSPLYYAACLGLIDTTKFLIHDRKHCIDEKSKLGRTALIIACGKGDVKIAEVLLESGANPTMRDNDERTAVYQASCKGHSDIVQLLLKWNAEITIPNKIGSTPIFTASLSGHLDVARLLFEKGADMTIPDNDGWTPLLAASSKGHLEIVRLLLEKGADITILNKDGWTAVNAASAEGHLEVVRLLLQEGAGITIPYKKGWTAILAARTKSKKRPATFRST